MSKRYNYFSIASRVFWILFGIIILFCLFRFGAPFFNSEGLVEKIVRSEEEIEEVDVAPSPPDSSNQKTYVWSWSAPAQWKLSGQKFKISFNLSDNVINSAKRNHISDEIDFSINNLYNPIYKSMYQHDKSLIQPMVQEYIKLAKSKNLSYIEVLELVVSSVQSIPYTWVLDSDPSCGESWFGNGAIPADNCTVNAEPNGCCDQVKYGVFSPIEFAVKKTGDCDTRSLFAFTILKSMGYDVAIMGSNSEHHSVLGVKVPGSPGDGKRGNTTDGQNYFLWELTAKGPFLGMSIGGSDWEVELK